MKRSSILIIIGIIVVNIQPKHREAIQQSLFLDDYQIIPTANLYTDDYFELSLIAKKRSQNYSISLEDIPDNWEYEDQTLLIPMFSVKTHHITNFILQIKDQMNRVKASYSVDLQAVGLVGRLQIIQNLSKSINGQEQGAHTPQQTQIYISYSIIQHSIGQSQTQYIYIYPQIISFSYSSPQTLSLNSSELNEQLENQINQILIKEIQQSQFQKQRYQAMLATKKVEGQKLNNQIIIRISQFQGICDRMKQIQKGLSIWLDTLVEIPISLHKRSKDIEEKRERADEEDSVIQRLTRQIQEIKRARDQKLQELRPQIPENYQHIINLTAKINDCKSTLKGYSNQITNKNASNQPTMLDIQNIQTDTTKNHVESSLELIRQKIGKLEAELIQARQLQANLEQHLTSFSTESQDTKISKMIITQTLNEQQLANLRTQKNRLIISCRQFEAQLYRTQISIQLKQDAALQPLQSYFKQLTKQEDQLLKLESQIQKHSKQKGQLIRQLSVLEQNFNKSMQNHMIKTEVCQVYEIAITDKNKQFLTVNRIIEQLQLKVEILNQKLLRASKAKQIYQLDDEQEQTFSLQKQSNSLDQQLVLQTFVKGPQPSSAQIQQTSQINCDISINDLKEQYGILQFVSNSAIVVVNELGRMYTLVFSPCTKISSPINPQISVEESKGLFNAGNPIYFTGTEAYRLMGTTIFNANKILILPK